MAEDGIYRRVKENFQRLEAFGWFSPQQDYFSQTFEVWPKGKSTNGLGYRQAAVLFLISRFRGELHVLITRRSHLVSSHKGMHSALLELKIIHNQWLKLFGLIQTMTEMLQILKFLGWGCICR